MDQTDEAKSAGLGTDMSAFTARQAHMQFGLGVGLAFVAVLLFLASFILIWFGVFPGLIAIILAIPMAVAGVRLVRKGQPVTSTPR